MGRERTDHIIVIGAGVAGLMAARELSRAGKRVTILEARDRCGGRIDPLPVAAFGYPAEGGAEFVHGEAPVTRDLVREARLSLLPIEGSRVNVDQGVFSHDEPPAPHTDRLHEVLAELTTDVTVTDFLAQHFPGLQYRQLRQSIVRMVEGYDAAEPDRASVLALRDEWMNGDERKQARIDGGYVGLIQFLTSECRKHGAALHLGAIVSTIETADGRALVHCADGAKHSGDAAILSVPLPLLQKITLPPALHARAAAAANIGFGNVIKFLLRFKSRWWTDIKGEALSDLLFVISGETVPVWWTQHPNQHPVLTGWLAGPRTNGLAHLSESELIETGLASLAKIFGLSPKQLKRDLVAARAINWATDPFAQGAYSYATLETRAAQSALARDDGGVILFSGEALYRGPDMGTVEAALASGLETARMILGLAKR